MPERSFPFDGQAVYEGDWLRMSRLWTPSSIVGSPGCGAYDLTVSGLTATVASRPDQTPAEAWVDGSMHQLTYDAASLGKAAFAVPVNTSANPRVDRLILRRDPAANSVVLALVQGTPAASPVAATLTQNPGGLFELPLWRFTVPASSGAPLTGLVDDRVWRDPNSLAVAIPKAVAPLSGMRVTTTVYNTASTPIVAADGGSLLFPDPGVLYQLQFQDLLLDAITSSSTTGAPTTAFVLTIGQDNGAGGFVAGSMYQYQGSNGQWVAAASANAQSATATVNSGSGAVTLVTSTSPLVSPQMIGLTRLRLTAFSSQASSSSYAGWQYHAARTFYVKYQEYPA